jgi:hypothetical protein
MIDITKHNYCDACDKTTSAKEKSPVVFMMEFKTKKVRLCPECLKQLGEDIAEIVKVEKL